MVLFTAKGVQGGVSQVSNRFKQANNPYVEGFNCKQTCLTSVMKTLIIYMDGQ